MPSLWSRVRRRSGARPVAAQTPPDEPPANEDSPAHILTHAAPAPPQPALDRRILPDVNALFESYAAAAPEAPAGPELPQGLRPSRRGSGGSAARPPRPSPPTAEALGELEELPEERRSSSAVESPEPSRMPVPREDDERERRNSGLLFRLSRLASPGDWSTFGRNRDYTSPGLVEFGRAHTRSPSLEVSPVSRESPRGSKRHSKSSSGPTPSRPANTPHASSASRPSTVPPPSSQDSHSASTPSGKSSFVHDSKKSSPSNTMSSHKKNSAQARSSSRAGPNPPPSFTRYLPSFGLLSGGLRAESPATFGAQTPPESRTFNFGSSPALQPAPPMPPLDHPVLSAARTRSTSSSRSPVVHSTSISSPSVQSNSQSTQSPAASQGHVEQHGPRERRDYTFPRRSQPRGSSSASQHSASLPLHFGRPRFHSNPPRIQQIFSKSAGKGKERERDTGAQGSRSRSRSEGSSSKAAKSIRRKSADFSAQAAANGKGSWQAEVSRQMVELALGSGLGSGTSRRTATARGEPRGGHVPGPENHGSFSQPTIPFPRQSPPLFHSRDNDDGQSDDDGGDEDLYTPQALSGDRDGAARRYLSLEGSAHRADSTHTPLTTPPRRPSPALQPDSLQPPQMFSGPRPVTSLQPPPHISFTKPTPEASPIRPHPERSASETSVQSAALSFTTPKKEASSVSKGKRKADDVDITPPDVKKEQRATFAVPADNDPRRSNKPSGSSQAPSSHAPSSYHRKRARLSDNPLQGTSSRPGSAQGQPHSHPLGQPLSGGTPSRPASRDSHAGRPPPPPPQSPTRSGHGHGEARSRRSLSQKSIPISALISPHAPSVARSGKFHMRDPRAPPRVHPTEWTPGAAWGWGWAFYVGFVLFPVWWIASVVRVRETRTVGGGEMEKAVVVDDPQVEHDARSWRTRCRVMAGVSLLTYIPFIVLVAVFVKRS